MSVKIIHSGHDLSWLENMPEKKPADVIRFGYIGQIIPVKGIELLVKAFKAANINENAQLLLYGNQNKNPDYLKSLQGLIQPEDGIQFEGTFPHENLGEVLAGIDVLVVPSQWHENNPRVIQEAFAAKVPVIASDVGGIAEFVQQDVNGLLFAHTSMDDLRVQIQRVLDEPDLLQRLREGIQPVRTIAEEVTELIDLYQELVESPLGKQNAVKDIELLLTTCH